MAKMMKNRTQNDIKNKWYSMQKTQKRAKEAEAQSETKPAASGTMPSGETVAGAPQEPVRSYDEMLAHEQNQEVAEGSSASKAYWENMLPV